VVCGVLRTQFPLRLVIEGTEQIHLHDNSALGGAGDEITQPFEVGVVPPGQVKFVSAVRITWCFGARPRTNESPWRRRERITGDVEGAVGFDVSTAERAGEVQAVPGQRVKVLSIVEVEIQ